MFEIGVELVDLRLEELFEATLLVDQIGALLHAALAVQAQLVVARLLLVQALEAHLVLLHQVVVVKLERVEALCNRFQLSK